MGYTIITKENSIKSVTGFTRLFKLIYIYVWNANRIYFINKFMLKINFKILYLYIYIK